jgi:zinc protease
MAFFTHPHKLLAVVLITVACTAQAQVNLNDKLPVDPAIKIGKLANGLTYYIRQNKKPEQKVELRLVVNAGAVLEDDDQLGLAHMSEHMAFNGTKNFKKNEIVSFLQNIGVGFGNDLNAYTSFDETVYMLPIPTDKPGNLEKGFQVLEDWAHNVTYLTDDINGERAVILEESRLGKGANSRMFDKVLPQLFAGSKYANRLPIGKDSIIKNFKPDRIRDFYKTWYRPNLMAVIVVGDIEPAKAEEMVKKHFSSLTNPANEKMRTLVQALPYTTSNAMVVTDKEATNYSVSINYSVLPAPPETLLADYRTSIVKQIFTSLLNQRLQELAQKENPPFLFASTNFNSFAKGYEAFNGFASAGTGDVSKALTALTTEIERVKKFGFTTPELERAKKNILSGYERSFNNRTKTESDNYVEEYIRNFLEQEAIPGIEKEYEYAKELLPGITIQEVNDVTAIIKKDSNHFVYVMGPDAKAGTTLPVDKDLLAVVDAVAKSDIKPYEEKAIAANLLSKEPVAGKITATEKNTLLNTTELILSNGVTVTLKETDFKADQLLMSAVRYGGKNGYSLADKFSADYAGGVVATMGYGNFSPTDMRKALAGKSVGVTPFISDITDGFRGNSSIKDMETFFQLLYLYATEPRIDTALFKSFIQKNKSQFAMVGANPQSAFIDTMYKVLYNNNPLAPVAVPKVENFDKINLERAVAIYKERVGDVSGMHFTFVGSFTPAQIQPFIEKYVASLPAAQKKPAFVDNKVRPIKGVKKMVVNKGKEQKSLILAFYTGETPYSEMLDLKAQAISEILNIRIIEELREKIQGIYGGGIYGGLSKTPYNNYSFVLQLPCGPEKADTLLKAAQIEINKLVKNGPSQVNLDKVKKQWLEQNKTQMKDNQFWLSSLQEQKLQGSDPKLFLNYEKVVNALTVKDIQDTAKKLFDGKNIFTAVLMPETVTTK